MLFLFYITPLADGRYLNLFKHKIGTWFTAAVPAFAFLRSHAF